MRKTPEDLTKMQQENFDTLMWLLHPGFFGSGRTYLMATCFLEIACRMPGSHIEIFDHVPAIQHIENQVVRLITEKYQNCVYVKSGRYVVCHSK